MSKIICDICGTSYPETATQCPICGCVRPSDVTVVSGDTNVSETAETGTYTHVKGGRFSKSNVRRRGRGQQSSVPSKIEHEPVEPIKAKNDRDTGLVVAVCVLLLAIVSAVIYIAIHFFSQAPALENSENTWKNPTTVNTSVSTTAGTDTKEIPCTDVLVSKTTVEFTNAGDTEELHVTKNPADTTDELIFTSSDEAVVKVSADGKIEAVGDGEAVITITCGTAKTECKVSCKFAVEETTVATQPTDPVEEEETPETTGAYKINKTDVTLWVNGEPQDKSFKLTLKDSNGNTKDVEWIVGDPSVCEVSGNTVTAKAIGITNIKVTIDGVTYKCRVIVK